MFSFYVTDDENFVIAAALAAVSSELSGCVDDYERIMNALRPYYQSGMIRETALNLKRQCLEQMQEAVR
ncbi:MAG: hypothetical protein QHG99_02725 [Methanomicrobiales archaeon]|nr:hypothetical protein [Methanomicrobiales archaeon]